MPTPDNEPPAVPSAPLPNDGIRLSTTVTVLLLAGGVLIALAAGGAGRCRGARRSVQLQFEERQAAIEQAVEAEDKATSAER